MRLRTLTGGAVVVIAAWVVGGAVLQMPSDGPTRDHGAKRVEERTVVFTVRFEPHFDFGGPHTVAVSWDSRLGPFGPPIDVGDSVFHLSPYVRKIHALPGAHITASAVPAASSGRVGGDWTTECWLHQDGKLLPGGRSHHGPVVGAGGCVVSGTAW